MSGAAVARSRPERGARASGAICDAFVVARPLRPRRRERRLRARRRNAAPDRRCPTARTGARSPRMTARYWRSRRMRRDGFVSGGDDGAFRRVDARGRRDATSPRSARNGWSTSRAMPATRAGLLACAVGGAVHLFDANGREAEDARRIRPPSAASPSMPRASASAPGITTGRRSGSSPRRRTTRGWLEWKGSHTGIAIHPDGTRS